MKTVVLSLDQVATLKTIVSVIAQDGDLTENFSTATGFDPDEFEQIMDEIFDKLKR